MSSEADNQADVEVRKRIELLGVLRNARAQLLEDAEGFSGACGSLERVGQLASGRKHNRFSEYETAILELTAESQLPFIYDVAQLFKLVTSARNDAVHEGAYARHVASRLIDLILMLEDSISLKMHTLRELMVRDPVTAEPWHLVAHVRNTMLAHSFSFIPYLHSKDEVKQWHLISDVDIVECLSRGNRKESLSLRIANAIGQGAMSTTPVACFRPMDLPASITPELKKGPVLVTEHIDGEEKLLGILTAFDLL